MKKKLTIGLLTVLALGACTEDDISEQQTLQDGTLRFAPEMVSDWNAPWTRSAADNDVAVQQLQDGLYLHTLVSPGISTGNTVTRGTKYEGYDVTGETYKSFKTDGTETFRVSGYRYGADENVSSVAHANFFDNVTVSYNNEWKATGQTYVMPAATDKTDFFGWFVADEETAGVTAEDAAGGLQLSYTVPADIDQQPDLLTAVAREEVFDATPGHTVTLAFAHQLTAVNFVLDENVAPGTITQIAFTNIYTSGTLSVSDGISGTWNLTNAPTETAYDTENFNTVNGNALRTGETIIGGLMMIPQQFTDATQRICITMTIDGTSRNLYADLKGTRWEPNTTVTYRVSTSAVNVLRIGTVSYPTSWSEASTENSDIKSAYANGDEIGVYGVDADGKVIFANKKYTLTGGSWVADDGTKSLFVPGHTYYAYYPYQATLSGGPAENANVMVGEALPTAAAFFADAITNWAPADDQSTATKLNAQDLQVSRSNPSTISTVTFSMAHAMGLTKVTLGTSKFTASVKYAPGGNSTGSTYTRSGQSVYFKATNVLSNSETPYWDGDSFFFVINGSKTFASVTTVDNEWNNSVTASPTAGAYTQETVYPKNNTAGKTYQGYYYNYINNTIQELTIPTDGYYTLEVWGARGGSVSGATSSTYAGGKGGYSIGSIMMTQGNKLYICVGGQGSNGTASGQTLSGGYNGGGKVTGTTSVNHVCASGGGATHVATSKVGTGILSAYSGNKDKIAIVAGGGGGGRDQPNHETNAAWGPGGVGGGLSGGGHLPGTQTGAGSGGGFGYGHSPTGNSAGGGGWYGGSSSCNGYADGTEGASGGSGYIGGVYDGNTIAGSASMPTTTASGTETGHNTHGYCRITLPVPVE